MLTRRLGRTDLDVSVLCFGGNVFGWTTDAAQSAAVLDAFMEAGGNFVDSADVYSRWVPGHTGGESEVILGQWMKDRGNRKDVIVATKLGSPMGEGKQGLSRKYMVQAVEDSLTRLQTDYIDLYQAHRDDQETPLEEIMAAFDDLVKQGKVRWIGASNFTAARLAEANAVAAKGGWARYESIQPRLPPAPALGLRGRAGAALPAGRDRRHHLLVARQRLPDRQVPAGCRAPEQRPSLGRAAALHERSRLGDPGGRRGCREATGRNAGPGGAGLDREPTRYDRPDRQRHDAGPVGGDRRRHRPEAGRRGDQHARQGERLIHSHRSPG